MPFPVSILYKSTAGRYRPVRVTARCRFIKNASWVVTVNDQDDGNYYILHMLEGNFVSLDATHIF